MIPRTPIRLLAAVVAAAVLTAGAQDAPATRDSVAELRLLPPTPASMSRIDLQSQIATLPALVRQRHPQVFEEATAAVHVVTLYRDVDGAVQRSTVTEVAPGDLGAVLRAVQPTEGARVLTVTFTRGQQLPDGTTTHADVTVVSIFGAMHSDETRALSRVHDAVRKAHPDLILPADGPILNRLTVLMKEDGTIERHLLEQSRREDLRRAPLEDAQFAERMAARIANVLSVDAARLGIVGFTYVIEADAPAAMQSGSRGLPRTVLVQYAWPRRPGEAGPSAPMTAVAQQATRHFDQQTALRMAEHYFPDAFSNTAPGAGTPTIALSPQGRVIATGRVQYGSGLNHERLVGEQLVPGIRTGAFLSPRLTNAAGQSAVVSFVWQAAGAP